MRLSQLIRDLIVLEQQLGGSFEVKLRVDDEHGFGPVMTNFWIEQTDRDIVLAADISELKYEDE
jgi:hypothetical protein